MTNRFRIAAALGASVVLSLTACAPSGSATGSTTTTTINPNAGPDCSPPSFHPGANFGSQCDLRNLTIDGVDLSPSSSSGGPSGAQTYAPDAHLEGTTIINSNLTDANFKYPHAHGASFVRSDFTGISLVGGGPGSESDLTDTVWTVIDATNASLQYADLSRAQLTNVHLEGANLTGSIWTDAVISGVTIGTNTICPDGASYDPVTFCRGSLPGF